MSRPRIPSLDVLRTVLIAGVVVGHYTPFVTFEGPPYRFLWVAIDQSLRFVIPAFFVLSGWLYGAALEGDRPPGAVFRAYARRVLTLYAFWDLFYLLVPSEPGLVARLGYAGAVAEVFTRTVTDPGRLVFEGFREPLWFLPSLIWGTGILTALRARGWGRAGLPLGLALFAAGLLAGPWADTPLGLPTGFNERNGPLFSTVFLAVGMRLRQARRPPPLALALGLSLLGWALYLAEVLALQRLFGTYPRHEYGLASLLWGPAVAMVALARPDLGRGTVLARLGPLVVGIYLAHLPFVDLARTAGRAVHHWAFELAAPALAFAATAAVVALASRVPGLRRFVR